MAQILLLGVVNYTRVGPLNSRILRVISSMRSIDSNRSTIAMTYYAKVNFNYSIVGPFESREHRGVD